MWGGDPNHNPKAAAGSGGVERTRERERESESEREMSRRHSRNLRPYSFLLSCGCKTRQNKDRTGEDKKRQTKNRTVQDITRQGRVCLVWVFVFGCVRRSCCLVMLLICCVVLRHDKTRTSVFVVRVSVFDESGGLVLCYDVLCYVSCVVCVKWREEVSICL